MKKNGLRTFICSFLLSLLTIFLADKALFRSQKDEKPSELKISNNNITLFLKDESKIIQAVKTQEVVHEDLLRIADSEDVKEYAELLEEEKSVYEESEDEKLFAQIEDVAPEKKYSSSADEVLIASAEPILSEDEKSEKADNLDEVNTPSNKNLFQKIPAKKPSTLASLEVSKDSTFSTELDQPASLAENSETESIVAKTEKIIAELSAEKIETQKNINNHENDDFIPIQRNYADNSNRKVNIKTKSTENEVAMVKEGIPIESMTKKEDTSWQKMNQANNSSPWVVAKSRSDKSNFIVPEEMNKTEDVHALELSKNLNIEPEKKENEIKVAEMVRNILIPIPDDIIKEGNVTPQLISSQKNKELQTKIEQSMNERRQENEPLVINTEKVEKEKTSEEPSKETEEVGEDASHTKSKKTILDSLSSIFSAATPVIGITKQSEDDDKSTDIYKSFSKKSKNKDKVTKILPTEIKLSFQPNRAEISGPTLRWIEAFANKVEEDKDVVLEIRIDGTSAFELQQKRLRLLHNILTNKGVEYSKINTVFTTREPNSFIIRAVRLENNTVERNNKEANNMSKIYQNW